MFLGAAVKKRTIPPCALCAREGRDVPAVAPCNVCQVPCCQVHRGQYGACPRHEVGKPPAGVRQAPCTVAERSGRLVRLSVFPKWVVEAELGPCPQCGSPWWCVLENRAKHVLALRCPTCLPADTRHGEEATCCFRVAHLAQSKQDAPVALEGSSG